MSPYRQYGVNDMLITVDVHGETLDVEVPRHGSGEVRADAVRARIELAVPSAVGETLIVDRSGTPLWGAAAGGDLLTGDRVVTPDRRSLPLLVAVSGPLAGERQPIWTVDSFHRGGRFGELVVEDQNTSERHVAFEADSTQVVLTDVGSSTGTTVNGVAVTDSVTLRTGDVVAVGGNELLFVAEVPPGPKRLVEQGRIFLSLDQVPSRSPWMPLTEVLAAGVAQRPPLWGVVAGHEHFLRVPVIRDEELVLEGLGRGEAVGVVGDPHDVEVLVAAWLARLAVLQGPSRFRLRIDATADSMLWRLRQAATWFPQNEKHPLDRPTWSDIPLLLITEPTDRRRAGSAEELQIVTCRDRRDLPGDVDVVVDLRDPRTRAAETLDVRVLETLARSLAPALPAVPVRPLVEPVQA